MGLAARVVIVGGGFAGLAAAKEMGGHLQVTLLESQSMVGGRARTVAFDDSLLELGAQWLHGTQGHPLHLIAKEHNLLEEVKQTNGAPAGPTVTAQALDAETVRPKHTGVFCREDGSDLSDSIGRHIALRFFRKVLDTVENGSYERGLAGNVGDYMWNKWQSERSALICSHLSSQASGDDHAADGTLSQEAVDEVVAEADAIYLWRCRLENSINGSHSLSHLSLDAFQEYEELKGKHTEIGKGYSSIADVLLNQVQDKCTVRFNSTVTSVAWDDDTGVFRTVCEDGFVCESEHVVLTPSVGVLKRWLKDSVLPTLPEWKVEAIESMGIGTVNKIMLSVDGPQNWSRGRRNLYPLWNEEHCVVDDPEVQPSRERWMHSIHNFHIQSPSLLIVWTVGDGSLLMESMSEDQIAADCQRILKMFSEVIEVPQVRRAVCSRWGSDPLFSGSYSFIRVGGSRASVERLSDPVVFGGGSCSTPKNGLLCFAGEASHPDYYSTTHGAYLSGVRESDRLLKEC